MYSRDETANTNCMLIVLIQGKYNNHYTPGRILFVSCQVKPVVKLNHVVTTNW